MIFADLSMMGLFFIVEMLLTV